MLAIRAGRFCLAIPIGLVRRVDPLPHLTRIPLAPSPVAGIAEIRGSVVTVLDGAAWLSDRPNGSSRASEDSGPG